MRICWTKLRLILLSVMSAAALFACGGGGGGGDRGGSSGNPSVVPINSTAASEGIEITGIVSKGLVNFASVLCYFSASGAVPQNMIPTVGDTTSVVPVDLEGRYSCKAPKTTKTMVAIVIPSSLSIMKDEATGVDVPMPTDFKYRAAIDITNSLDSKINLNISPFSEAGVSLAEKNGGLVPSAINKANSGIANIIGFNHLSTNLIQSGNAIALASATLIEKKFSALTGGLSELAATDGARCGVKPSLGAVINCTVGKLSDQFQLTTIGAAPVVVLSDEGRQNLLAGGAAIASKFAALKDAAGDLRAQAMTTTQNAVELTALMALNAVDSTQRGTGRAEYQQKVAGNKYSIEVADDVYRYAVMSAMIYDDQWIDGSQAGQNLGSTALVPITYSVPTGYQVLDTRKYGINSNSTDGLQWGVFYNDTEIVFTYRGTEPKRVLDWVADLTIVACRSAQYGLALSQFDQLLSNATFSNEFLNANKKREIVLTGHSLGGGIASYIVTNSKYAAFISRAVGFNSAPLCKVGQIFSTTQANKDKITRITISGEPVLAVGFAGLALNLVDFLGNNSPIYSNPFSALANQLDSHSIYTELFALDSTRSLCTWSTCRRVLGVSQPAVTAIQQPTPLSVDGLQTIFSTALMPFVPSISISGNSLSIFNNISWSCVQPSGVTCAGSPYVWTPSTWAGKVDVVNDSVMKVYPTFIASGDATGTYNWTVTFAGVNVSPVTKSFQVTYQPQSATGLVINLISSPQFANGTSSISTSTKAFTPSITVSGQNLGTVVGIEWRWSGAVNGSASWSKTDSTWPSKVTLTADGKLVLSPTVVEANPTWSGTAIWIGTLKDATGSSRNITFSVTYQPITQTLVCAAPQVLQGNQCVAPATVCAAPQVLVNGVCTSGAVSDVVPTVTAVTPTSMVGSSTTQTVTISGSFQSGNYVQFIWGVGTGSGVWTTSTQAMTLTSSSISIPMIPGLVNDTIRVRVCNSAGSCSANNPSITVSAPAPVVPTVTAATPTSMVGSSTTQTVTISGSFQSGNYVQFIWGVGTGSGVWTTSTQAMTLTSSSISIPMIPGLVNDTIRVRVCNSAGSCSANNPSITVSAPAPVLSSLNPNPVPRLSTAQTVTIFGSNFVSGATVTLVDIGHGGTFSKATTFVSSGQLTISANFTTTASQWSATVVNPNGQLSGTLNFNVQ